MSRQFTTPTTYPRMMGWCVRVGRYPHLKNACLKWIVGTRSQADSYSVQQVSSGGHPHEAPASHSDGLVHRIKGIKVLLVGLHTEGLTTVYVMAYRGNAKNCGDTWSKIFKKELGGILDQPIMLPVRKSMCFLRDTHVFASLAACICVLSL